jgi:hypothetical protein
VKAKDSGLKLEQRNGEKETKPHGREWMRNATGYEEEQTAKVVRNGEGGTK